MRKLWLCLFYALCVFTIVFSLFWMALPRLPPGRADSAEETPVPSLPSISVQAVPETGSTTYYRHPCPAGAPHRHLCQPPAGGRRPARQAGAAPPQRDRAAAAAGRSGRVKHKNSPGRGSFCLLDQNYASISSSGTR